MAIANRVDQELLLQDFLEQAKSDKGLHPIADNELILQVTTLMLDNLSKQKTSQVGAITNLQAVQTPLQKKRVCVHQKESRSPTPPCIVDSV